ncbi:serine/threonine-protein kinase [Amycolatopsis taiwanensis]|nr:serine/threonine-protein kinase [Amycolatopsis taiwanensis]
MPEPMGVQVERGQLISGRYELLKRLGRGGMGEVWAARDRSLHREVALKVLDLDGADHPDLAKRFEREAVAAAQINHPNVVALYDRGIHEDVMFLVMEKVEGGTLTGHIRAENALTLSRAVGIASGICAALTAAHQAGVIHYDIKPHNVMLTPDGRVKVLDFGIAGFIQATFSVPHSSQLAPAFTIEYAAPEQFLSERGDERSDLYSLGSVLFALLAQRPPFTGHNGVAVMRAKLDEEAPRLDSFRDDLPPAVTELVAELLQRDPGRRPPSARLVGDRLARLQTASAQAKVNATKVLPATDTATARPPRTRRMETTPSSETDEGFAIGWTGNDPLDAYADAHGLGRVYIRLRVGAILGLLGVLVALIVAQVDGFPPEIWLPVLVVSGTVGGQSLIFRRRVTRVWRRDTSSWSLRIGPRGIRTTKGSESHDYRWSEIRRFGVEEVYAPKGTGREPPASCNAGLYLELTDTRQPAGPQPVHRPAGWPWRLARAVDRDGMIPVCVLGPMTDRQETALWDALAQYGARANTQGE